MREGRSSSGLVRGRAWSHERGWPGTIPPTPRRVLITSRSPPAAGKGRAGALRFELRIDVEEGAVARPPAAPSDARADEPARLPIYILSFLAGVALGAGAVRLKLREPAHGLRPGL